MVLHSRLKTSMLLFRQQSTADNSEDDNVIITGDSLGGILIFLLGLFSLIISGAVYLIMPSVFPLVFFPLVLFFILIIVFYIVYRKKEKCRNALWLSIAGFIGIDLIAVALIILLFSFEHSSSLYLPKKLLFDNCVYSPFSDECEILPDKLPSNYRDFKFKTQGKAPARHYYASAYLAFHTDNETLKKYEDLFKGRADFSAYSILAEKFDGIDFNTYAYPQEFPAFDFLDKVHKEDLLKIDADSEEQSTQRNLIVYSDSPYQSNNRYDSKGCLIDYDSGLVVFWT